jgi:hypothetical protein
VAPRFPSGEHSHHLARYVRPFSSLRAGRLGTPTVPSISPCPPSLPPLPSRPPSLSLMGEIPNLYVYACNNPSESILAKRRGYGK